MNNNSNIEMYQTLRPLIVTKSQLIVNFYPHTQINARGFLEVVVKNPEGLVNQRLWNEGFRKCGRCTQMYNMYMNVGLCIHHPKRFEFAGTNRIHPCCNLPTSAEGCHTNYYHVCSHLPSPFCYLRPPIYFGGFPGIFALDCELSFTHHGLELTRATLINHELTTILDVYVKPTAPILDYNTEYSGITAETLENITLTRHQCRALILSIMNEQSILIGHSLESDLKALGICHEVVIDTSLLFMQLTNTRYKPRLSVLAKTYLEMDIQTGSGHDSVEDARACMMLVQMAASCDSSVFHQEE